MSEQEEFEFRLRLENEKGAKPPQSKPKQQSIHNATTVYDPVSGVPLYSEDTSEGEALGGVAGVVDRGIRAAAALPISFAAGASRPFATVARALPGSFGKNMSEAQTSLVKGLSQATDSSFLVPGFNLAGEIAGTAGAGGVLAKGASKIPMLAKTGLPAALSTGGFSSGGVKGLPGLATRIAGGAVTGAAAAGLVNPEDAGLGAVIGGGIQAGLPVLKAVGKGVTSLGTKALGGVAGVGDEALGQAYRAGKAGGATDDIFVKNMRGQASIEDVLDTAKQNMQTMVKQKQDVYRSGMVDIKGDKSILGFDGIDKAVNDAFGMVSFKGQVKNTKAAESLQEIADDIASWKSLSPDQYHTPEGLDALKQRIGAVLESIPYEQKTARKAVGDVYNAVKTEISNQAPSYSKVMGDYSKASDTITEIERALSLGQKSSADTAVRKLQSLMRNNANTNYGSRTALVSKLETEGGREILPALAGQSLNTWTPRGIQRAMAGTGGAGLALTGNIPAAVGLGAVSSPRLLGEAYRGVGKLSGLLTPEDAYLFSQIPQRAYFDSKK